MAQPLPTPAGSETRVRFSLVTYVFFGILGYASNILSDILAHVLGISEFPIPIRWDVWCVASSEAA